MRDPKRIRRILKLIEEIWYWNPDLRLGQLLVNASPDIEDHAFGVEDDDIERELVRFASRMRDEI